MNNSNLSKNKEYKLENPFLKNAKLLYWLMAAMLVVDWIMPPYFGIHIGFDFTCTRILNMIILMYFVYNKKVGNHFVYSMLEIQATPYLALIMLVMVYTTILRANVNTFFLNFLDILTFYMVYYGIRYLVGLKKTMQWTIRIIWFFAIYGLVEYVLGFSPMLKYLKTVESGAKIVYRSGQYRIMGPCLHSIGYGLLIMFMIALICWDYDNDEVYLFQHPILYVLLMLNMFLTGSRGPLGLVVLESFLIILASKGKKKKQTFILIIGLVVFMLVFEISMYSTSIGQYIMMQITSILDELLGTQMAIKYGADMQWLEDSSDYREYLPLVFTVDWLNPFIGQGANAQTGFEFDGFFVKSIDNYYVALYIRYAYPGLIATVLFQIATVVHSLRTAIRYKSGFCYLCAISFTVYYVNLYWVDYLMTTKFMYIVLAMYATLYSTNFRSKDMIRKKSKDRSIFI